MSLDCCPEYNDVTCICVDEYPSNLLPLEITLDIMEDDPIIFNYGLNLFFVPFIKCCNLDTNYWVNLVLSNDDITEINNNLQYSQISVSGLSTYIQVNGTALPLPSLPYKETVKIPYYFCNNKYKVERDLVITYISSCTKKTDNNITIDTPVIEINNRDLPVLHSLNVTIQDYLNYMCCSGLQPPNEYITSWQITNVIIPYSYQTAVQYLGLLPLTIYNSPSAYLPLQIHPYNTPIKEDLFDNEATIPIMVEVTLCDGTKKYVNSLITLRYEPCNNSINETPETYYYSYPNYNVSTTSTSVTTGTPLTIERYFGISYDRDESCCYDGDTIEINKLELVIQDSFANDVTSLYSSAFLISTILDTIDASDTNNVILYFKFNIVYTGLNVPNGLNIFPRVHYSICGENKVYTEINSQINT